MTFAQLKTNIEATPGASWRPEEILFRFGENAQGATVVKGGHITVLAKRPEPDGDIRVATFGPYKLATLADEPVTKGLLGATRIALQAALDDANAEIADLKQKGQALIAAHQVKLAELTTAHQTALTEQATAHAAALAEKDAAHTAAIATLTEQHAAAMDALREQHAATLAAAVKAKEDADTAHAETVTKLTEARDQAIADRDAARTAQREAEAERDALGTKPEAAAIMKAKKIAELLKQAEAADAQAAARRAEAERLAEAV